MDKKKNIVEAYKNIVSEKKLLPKYSDFLNDHQITRNLIRQHFNSLTNLHEYMKENNSNFLNGQLYSIENMFDSNKDASFSTKKRFLVTTAVADSKAHSGFLSAMENYAKRNDAEIIIMPCESVTNSFENKKAVFDEVFMNKNYKFVQRDTHLNENISLCSIQVSAKQVKPISGLSRLGNREGSYVFASPKQFLEYIPAGNSRSKNYSIMTTGACTVPNYYNEVYISKRLSYVADKDHCIGAIVIEIEDDKIFHFRQIQAAKDGSFIDLGVNYFANGTIEQVSASIVFGDLHGVQADVNVLKDFIYGIKHIDIDAIYLHDVFDGVSISHHIQKISDRFVRHVQDNSSLEIELKKTGALVETIYNALGKPKVKIVKSNHDEFLTRYLENGRYTDDPINHYAALKIATALFEKEDVLKRGFEVVGQNTFDWEFLPRDCTDKIGKIELGAHGDLGMNGSFPSLASFERIYGDCVVGHNHSAAIHRGVFRVGTMSHYDLGYNRGPSSWTQTNCIVYANGQRQLLNIINEKFTTMKAKY